MPKPVTATLAVTVAAVIAVVLVVVVVVTNLGAGNEDVGTHAAAAPTVPTAAPTTATSPGAGSPTDGAGTGWSGSAEGGAASEVIPQASPAPSSLADLLPSDTPSAGTYASAPPDADAAGSLAPGFPSQVIYVPGDATVRSSSITTDSGRSQAALDATVPGPCAALLIATRDWYTRGGFTDRTLAETPDGAHLEFTRDDASIAIMTRPADSGCSVVLAGVLTPATGAAR